MQSSERLANRIARFSYLRHRAHPPTSATVGIHVHSVGVSYIVGDRANGRELSQSLEESWHLRHKAVSMRTKIFEHAVNVEREHRELHVLRSV